MDVPAGAQVGNLQLTALAELRQLRIELQGAAGDGAASGVPGRAPLPSLWDQQAIAVRDYLVQHGVAPERVVAQVIAGSPVRGRAPRVLLKVAAEPRQPPR